LVREQEKALTSGGPAFRKSGFLALAYRALARLSGPITKGWNNPGEVAFSNK
jgi:hypothetical protein